LFEPLIVADAGIAAGGEHVDECVLGDNFQLDVGIGGEERWDDRRQHQARRADRHVEAQCAGGTFAIAIHHIERRFDLGKRRAKLFQ
jgi:hypothetical protein